MDAGTHCSHGTPNEIHKFNRRKLPNFPSLQPPDSTKYLSHEQYYSSYGYFLKIPDIFLKMFEITIECFRTTMKNLRENLDLRSENSRNDKVLRHLEILKQGCSSALVNCALDNHVIVGSIIWEHLPKTVQGTKEASGKFGLLRLKFIRGYLR